MSKPDMNMRNITSNPSKLLIRQRIRAALSDVSDLNSMENFNIVPKSSESVLKTTPGQIKKCSRPANSKKTTYKHVPHSQKPAHLVARRNERERKRVQAVNSAFLQLRKHVPHEPKHKRLSKFKTLKVAIHYIRHLQDMILSHDIEMATKYNYSKPCQRDFLNQNNKTLKPCQRKQNASLTHSSSYFHPAHNPVSIHHQLSFDSIGTGSSFEMESHCIANKTHDLGLRNADLYFDEHLDSSVLDNCNYHHNDSGDPKYSPNSNVRPCVTNQWLTQERDQFVDNTSIHTIFPRTVSERANHLGRSALPGQSSSQWHPSPEPNPFHQPNFSSYSSTENRSHSATPDSMTSSTDSWNTSVGIPCNFMQVTFQENSSVGREISPHSPFFT